MFDLRVFIETFIIEPICSRVLSQVKELLNRKDAQLITYDQAREKLRISKPIFYRILKRKELPTVELEKKTFRIDLRDLENFINNNKKYGKDEIK